jgi:hypothetical protein
VSSSLNHGILATLPDLEFVPLRKVPDSAGQGDEGEDGNDHKRIKMVIGEWRAQDETYLAYSRTVEEHVRFLSGRHWDVWSAIQGKFIDALQYMTENERRWRHKPSMDYLTYWFLLTHAKVTENPPAVSFMPGNADRESAMLAEVMEPLHKFIFQDAEMDDVNMKALAWALVAGQAYIMSMVDPEKGDETEQIGPAVLSLAREDGSTIERPVDAVPFDEKGEPLAKLVEQDDGEVGYDVTGEPYKLREGAIDAAALCPLEVRAEWGQNVKWNRKRWMTHRWFKTPAEVKKLFGIDVEADAFPDGDSGPGYLERLLFGAGYFGSARGDMTAIGTSDNTQMMTGYVCGYTRWERPDGARLPKGRLTIVTEKHVLWDSERPYDCEAAGPIRQLGWVQIPGRPFPTTVLERMVPIQKRLNRVEAQIAEHTDKCTNPMLFAASNTGIDPDDFEATPGKVIEYEPIPGQGEPAHWLPPGNLSSDVWRHKEDLRQQLFIIGGMAGNDGTPPTSDPSGDLIQELRFNADRTIAPLIRSLVLANADVAQDWIAMLPTIWTEEKIISIAGDDSVVRTVTVLPEMFQGAVHVRPIIESAAPESRQERQQRVEHLFGLGAFGDPQVPGGPAVSRLLELSRFPDLNRASRPGGIHRVTAERNLGKLSRGESADSIPLLEVYDFDTHIAVTEDHMASPEFLDYPEPVQEQFHLLRQRLKGAAVVKMVRMGKQAAGMAGVAAALTGAVQHAQTMSTPAAPAGPDGESPTNNERPAGNAGSQGAAA